MCLIQLLHDRRQECTNILPNFTSFLRKSYGNHTGELCYRQRLSLRIYKEYENTDLNGTITADPVAFSEKYTYKVPTSKYITNIKG